MKPMSLVLAALIALAASCRAGDALVEENFDKLNLGALPVGWTAAKDEVSLIDVDGRGKVLRINQQGQGRALFKIDLDRQTVAGGTVSVKVRAKLAQPYAPDAAKNAYIFVGFSFTNGTSSRVQATMIPSNLPDWYELSPNQPIAADVQGVSVVLGITGLAGDVYFDDLVITLSGKALLKQEGGDKAELAVSAAGKISAPPVDATPEQRKKLSGLPEKSLSGDGFHFDASVFITGQNAVKSGMKKCSYAVVGPGAPLANITAKSIPNWSQLGAEPKSVQGIATENLAVSLPTFLTTNKPEVAFLVSGAKTERLPADERSEWEDLAGLCYRYGTIPVIVLPADEEQRKILLEAAQTTKCAVLDHREPLDRRMHQLLAFIEEFILERKPLVKDVDE